MSMYMNCIIFLLESNKLIGITAVLLFICAGQGCIFHGYIHLNPFSKKPKAILGCPEYLFLDFPFSQIKAFCYIIGRKEN